MAHIHRNMLDKPVSDPSGELRNYVVSPELGATETLTHENILEPGARVRMHSHAVEEVIICIEGSGEFTCASQDPVTYGVGDVIIIPANEPHTLRNTGGGKLRQLCFFPATSSQATWIEPDAFGGKYFGARD